MAPHALYTNEPESIKASRALADRLHIPVIIHLSETKDEMKTSDEKYHMTPTAFLSTVERAVTLYRTHPERWLALMRNGMRQDWSWRRSAAEYEKLYQRLCSTPGTT